MEEEALDQIALRFKAGVTIKDRSYRLSTYPSCFVGREAVDHMTKDGLAATREEAVKLGQCIMSLFDERLGDTYPDVRSTGHPRKFHLAVHPGVLHLYWCL